MHAPSRSRRTVVRSLALGALGTLALVGSAGATAPGRNGQIAFKRFLDHEKTASAIFVAQPDGSSERQLTHPGADTYDDQPDWAADGSLIAFRRCVPDGPCAVYTVRPNGMGERRLTVPCTTSPDQCVDEAEVAVLPDSRRVVLTRATGSVREFPDDEGFIEHSDIVIRRLDGSGQRVVLRGKPFTGDNIEMVASPKGGRLAFVRSNSPIGKPAGGIAVFVVDMDGKHLHRVTPWSLRGGDHPDWSPDGRWILFRSNDDGAASAVSQLYLVHPDGSGLHAITRFAADAAPLSASFSPDGRRITFAMRGTDGEADVYTMRVDGTDVRPMTRTAAWDSAPDWGPRLGWCQRWLFG